MHQLQFFDRHATFKDIKHEFDLLFKTSAALTSLRINLFLLLCVWTLFGLFYSFLPPHVPLFFSKPRGEEQLVTKQFLVLLPAITTVLFIVNSRIASISLRKDKLIAYIVLWAQVVCSLLAVIILIRIILLIA